MHGGRTSFFSGRRKVSGYTLQKRTSKRTSPERVRSPCGLGRGGVSFSVASDHRDRDRCDQPPRSRCRGQHRGSARSLSFLLLLSVLLLSFSLFLLLFPLPSHFLNFFLYLSRLVSSSFRALSSFNLRFPNVSIARLRVPPRR